MTLNLIFKKTWIMIIRWDDIIDYRLFDLIKDRLCFLNSIVSEVGQVSIFISVKV